METMKLQKKVTASAMLDPKIVVPAIRAAFAKLDPRLMIKNPVMFVVEIVATLTTVIFLRNLVVGGEGLAFTFQIILWLWFTVLFANFAEAVTFFCSLVVSMDLNSEEGSIRTDCWRSSRGARRSARAPTPGRK